MSGENYLVIILFLSSSSPNAFSNSGMFQTLTEGPFAAGRVPDGTQPPGQPLIMAKGEDDDVSLGWGLSCLTTDTDFTVYSGPLGEFDMPSPLTCTTAGGTFLFDVPVVGDRFFLVAPHNTKVEGSYGTDSHRDTLASMATAAGLYIDLERYEQAETLYLESLDTMTRVLGPDHPNTLIAMSNLGGLYNTQTRYGEAEPLLAGAVAGAGRSLPREHVITGATIRKYAVSLTGLGRYDDAELQLLPLRLGLSPVSRDSHRASLADPTSCAEPEAGLASCATLRRDCGIPAKITSLFDVSAFELSIPGPDSLPEKATCPFPPMTGVRKNENSTPATSPGACAPVSATISTSARLTPNTVVASRIMVGIRRCSMGASSLLRVPNASETGSRLHHALRRGSLGFVSRVDVFRKSPLFPGCWNSRAGRLLQRDHPRQKPNRANGPRLR